VPRPKKPATLLFLTTDDPQRSPAAIVAMPRTISWAILQPGLNPASRPGMMNPTNVGPSNVHLMTNISNRAIYCKEFADVCAPSRSLPRHSRIHRPASPTGRPRRATGREHSVLMLLLNQRVWRQTKSRLIAAHYQSTLRHYLADYLSAPWDRISGVGTHPVPLGFGGKLLTRPRSPCSD